MAKTRVAHGRVSKSPQAQLGLSRTQVLDPKRQSFNSLHATTKHISQRTITSRWSALPEKAQQRISGLLAASKRPVTVKHWDDRRRAEADATINMVIRRVEKQLPRMPFPPRTKEAHFNLDKLRDMNRMTEIHLTAIRHTSQLLKAEIAKEEEELDRDRGILADLEANARAEERERKKRTVKHHPLLQLPQAAHSLGDDAESINLAVKPKVSLVLSDLLEDAQMAPILEQLGDHLDTMRGNHEQLYDLDEVLERLPASIELALRYDNIE